MSDRDDALPDLDFARQDIQDVGLRRYTIMLRSRSWAGGSPGLGVMTPTDLPLTPMPRVRVVSEREIAGSGGTYEDGDYRVDKVTPGYSALDTGAVTFVGSGSGIIIPSTAVPLTGVSVGPWQVVVRILSGTTFQYSLDGGATFIGPLTIIGSVSLPGTGVLPTGLSIAMSGAFNAGDTYSFTGESGGYTPAQLKPRVTAANQDQVIMFTGDDGNPREATLVRDIGFDRAFGYRFVIRPRRASPT